MTKREFHINLSGAKTAREICETPEVPFWDGYSRGLNRYYHGEIFGTDDEHNLWMNLASTKTRDRRHYLGLGYRCGFAGTKVTEAMEKMWFPKGHKRHQAS